jgi:hypothetical protein
MKPEFKMFLEASNPQSFDDILFIESRNSIVLNFIDFLLEVKILQSILTKMHINYEDIVWFSIFALRRKWKVIYRVFKDLVTIFWHDLVEEIQEKVVVNEFEINEKKGEEEKQQDG